MSASPENKVRYNPGNLGDLLKHGWLAEIASFLHEQKGGKPLRYADTFCGFAEYGIDAALAQRIVDRFHVPSFQRLQEPFLARGRYAGSVTLAGLAAKGCLEASIFDVNPAALASFSAAGAKILEIRSGYDILDSEEPYDLIFLDPYDDVWTPCEAVLAKSATLLHQSSILFFFPSEQKSSHLLTAAVDGLGINCLTAFVKNPGSSLDGTQDFATVFMPCSDLNVGRLLGLFGDLNVITAKVRKLAAPS